MSDYCLYPSQCGIGMDCLECDANHKRMLKEENTNLRQIITELVAFCERPEIVHASGDSLDLAIDANSVIQQAKRFLSGGEHE